VVFEKGDDIFSDPRELFKDMFGGEKFKEFFGEVSFGTELAHAVTPQANFCRGTERRTLIPCYRALLGHLGPW
jgi:hypothetical protein